MLGPEFLGGKILRGIWNEMIKKFWVVDNKDKSSCPITSIFVDNLLLDHGLPPYVLDVLFCKSKDIQSSSLGSNS